MNKEPSPYKELNVSAFARPRKRRKGINLYPGLSKAHKALQSSKRIKGGNKCMVCCGLGFEKSKYINSRLCDNCKGSGKKR